MFDTPTHVFWTIVVLALDAAAIVRLVRVVRRRRANDGAKRSSEVANRQRNSEWAKTLDEREAGVTQPILSRSSNYLNDGKPIFLKVSYLLRL